MKMKLYEALALGIRHAMEKDTRVILLGSGFGGLSPEAQIAFATLESDFGDRVYPIPISELGLAGACIGASLAGSRALVDLSTGSFLLQALPQVINEAANIHYMTGGQTKVPATFYSLIGVRGAGAAQHSHRPQAWVVNTPGIRVLLPANSNDAYWFMRWALLESENPTCFFSHALLLNREGEVNLESMNDPVGKAVVVREGSDVTVVTVSVMVERALKAAEELFEESRLSVEVIDLRSLSPLDRETVISSVSKTGRVVIAEESSRTFGPAAELAAILVEGAFPYLRGPIYRACTADVPIPFSPPLEKEVLMDSQKLKETIRLAVGGKE